MHPAPTTNLEFHANTKHEEIDYYFVRERVTQKLSDAHLMFTRDQVRDGFAKAFNHHK
jgi:hypothetical protein